MPTEIKHRFTDAVLHTVEADTLSEANLAKANLRGAYLARASLAEANLRGANLRGVYLRGADLSRANLRGADLTGASLTGANLAGANLAGASLTGANLFGANLRGADLGVATINGNKLDRLLARAMRVSDGHEFFLFALQDGPPKIIAGCRWMTIADYRAHVAAKYPDTDKARETLNILNYFEACIHD
jgi:hypothetical protein